MLGLMGKYTNGLTPQVLRRVFHNMHEASIAPHINLIVGFPGDTAAEAEATVDFTADILASSWGATYTLNKFVLYPNTPIQLNPSKFGVEPYDIIGDMPSAYPFKLDPSIVKQTMAAIADIPRFEQKLLAASSVNSLPSTEAGRLAASFYLGGGHGAIMKASNWLFAAESH